MKKLIFSVLFVALAFGAQAQRKGEAQKPEGYQITDKDCVEVTSIKDQSRSGTCWSFSGTAFLESEILKNGGEVVDLSEMWIVRHCYELKAEKFVRMHGKLNFGQGGAT
ncbi:MAG: aminopeptidase, partial [Rikenellaceae bacterium]|nr:aminopeptidase [Rikenellaceae bacterium]